MGKSLVDYFLANKIITLRKAQSVNEKPFSYELNKKLPSTITKDSLLPENAVSLPEVPETLKPLANDFLQKLKRLDVLKAELQAEQEKFAKTISTQTAEKNSLQMELNKMAQELGPAILKIDPEIKTVIATLSSFLIAAQSKEHTKVENSLVPEAQLELMKGIMGQVNKELAEAVLTKFDLSLEKYKVVNTTIEQTIRVWPQTQKIQKGNKILVEARLLVSQVEQEIKAMMFDLHDSIIEGISNMLQLNTTIEDGIKQLKQTNNVVPMHSDVPVGKAAMRLTNAKGQFN